MAIGVPTKLNSWPLQSHSKLILRLSGSSIAIDERSCIPRCVCVCVESVCGVCVWRVCVCVCVCNDLFSLCVLCVS